MTVTTDELIIEKNRLESQLQDANDMMERAAGYERRKKHRAIVQDLTAKLIKVKANILYITAKKQ
jgi:hypothetical protein